MTDQKAYGAAGVTMPDVEPLRAVLAALDGMGITAAVGGSGLLAALGLTDRVRDWDVTTDADSRAVEAALAGAAIRYAARPSGDGAFATRARLHVDGGDHEIDIIIGFAVRAGGRVHELPTRVTGRWLGLPLADPAVWARAYRLIGRDGPADLLHAWLAGRA